MAEWAWDPDDFAGLWYSDANDRIPNIMRYTSRFSYWDEFEANKVAVRQRYDEDEFEQIQLALHTLASSDMRIAILGGTRKYQGSDGSERVYRIIGARNLYQAAILWQFTQGETEGRFRLRTCRPENLPAQVAATIPARDAGAQPPITVHPTDVRDAQPTNRGNTPAERYRQLLAGPGDGSGSARLLVGAFNTDPKPTNIVQWYDLPDGRYLELRAEHIDVRPATHQDLAARFNTWIERAVQRMRDDQYEETW